MIPFSPPRIDQKIIDEVVDTLKSGWWTTGPKTKLFEAKLADYTGVKSILAISSATTGLELILRWFGVKEGDEVIVPVYTYCATANVVVHCGAIPVFVDVNPDDFNISTSEILKKITSRTKVIIPVDLGGFPADYTSINKIVEDPDIKKLFIPDNEIQKKLGRILVLSDAAHSFGAEYKGRKTGILTDVSVFSFHAVKNLATGEGGAIALNLPSPFDNVETQKSLAISSLHGQNKDALSKMQIGNWRYDVIEAGYKSNMTDILASIGIVELSRYDNDTILKRKKIFLKYSEEFSKYSWAEIPTYITRERQTSFHVYLLRIKGITEIERDKIIQNIFDLDVSVNVHFQPLPMLSVYKKMGYKMDQFPVAYDNYSREISLPVYYDLSDEQIDEVVRVVIKSVEVVLKIKKTI
jgi:dTDP-4-amino-4,6-dideoxygalactose transaminase